ncbi:putative selenium-dependent hydroxylase accessory protein YqeC [Sedimentibacter hydroxybenzoicus DSM 7310]|uniref:Selenium-dependent hydroxylase accessory protein YqeC n=1 Tax=Sedimentibacter hydroxybenzoicus DSM 7310 TaxID=1123245 RepID=A0A974BGC5_SEDHY|nr:selenium cofactor biosynthesis protein YqeC [Sedimentibacter hydroxybenzoicus]NYB72573.1 putative selenium-dependent hydroxylase accessory protein YqeC [Sedimentibacter hydroxybenzoicus DSM 7310]
MNSLSSIFNIKKGDIVSIAGSGGKTTLMYRLANELKDKYKVLVTTSTKIYMPDKKYKIYTTVDSYINSFNKLDNGITVIAKDLNIESNKLIGINDDDLDILIKYFDIILIEADGSRGLPLKGWKEDEPVILKASNKTIGIIPANTINKNITTDFVHNHDEFNILTDYSNNLDFEAIGQICIRKDGLFKNSRGNLYLFLNQADTEEDIKNSGELFAYLEKYKHNFKTCWGSLKKEEYYEC